MNIVYFTSLNIAKVVKKDPICWGVEALENIVDTHPETNPLKKYQNLNLFMTNWATCDYLISQYPPPPWVCYNQIFLVTANHFKVGLNSFSNWIRSVLNVVEKIWLKMFQNLCYTSATQPFVTNCWMQSTCQINNCWCFVLLIFITIMVYGLL